MIIYRLYEAQKIKNKLSLNLAMACIFIFSSCATVKDVGTISEVSQAVMTGGASLVPLPGNDKVKIAINGRVILSTKCNFDYSQNHIEVSLDRYKSKIAFIAIDKNNEFKSYVTLSAYGIISVKLFKTRDSVLLDEKTVVVSLKNDRISIDLNSCNKNL